MQRRVFLAFAVLLCLPVVAQSAVIIVGSNQLLPNTANQRVAIFITGGEMINGADLAASVGSGVAVSPAVGPTPNAVDGPTISAADIIGSGTFAATIFTGNNLTQSASGSPGTGRRTIEVGTTTSINIAPVDENGNQIGPDNFYSATATGRLGTLVFNTTGIFATSVQQTWQLLLGGALHNTVPTFGGTDIGTTPASAIIFATVQDGNVFIPDDGTLDRPPDGPEPASIVLALFAAAGVAAVAIRRRRCASPCPSLRRRRSSRPR
jgi:hypothetical protein